MMNCAAAAAASVNSKTGGGEKPMDVDKCVADMLMNDAAVAAADEDQKGLQICTIVDAALHASQNL